MPDLREHRHIICHQIYANNSLHNFWHIVLYAISTQIDVRVTKITSDMPFYTRTRVGVKMAHCIICQFFYANMCWRTLAYNTLSHDLRQHMFA